MNRSEIFSISDFAEFTRTTRDTLLYYDKIHLLSPAARGENQYRYYSSEQLALVNLIRTCQALGMKLAEIKELAVYRTP
ncbi:MAG: MerR family transcriptional regulator [Peptococcaceae bacterium]|jgi:DNA-binding transcriptional MerR regulator|nr:MerR family transcriptional regulator [Peptococcaceae bacterium]